MGPFSDQIRQKMPTPITPIHFVWAGPGPGPARTASWRRTRVRVRGVPVHGIVSETGLNRQVPLANAPPARFAYIPSRGREPRLPRGAKFGNFLGR